jgi:hypothetical protein
LDAGSDQLRQHPRPREDLQHADLHPHRAARQYRQPGELLDELYYKLGTLRFGSSGGPIAVSAKPT